MSPQRRTPHTGFFLFLMLAAQACATVQAGDPVSVARTFSAALSAGDEQAALELLSPEVVVYETGGVESSRDEYRQHHLKADIEFMSGVTVEVIDQEHASSGDLAWVATRSRIKGTYKNKPVDMFSNETLALRRVKDAWQITHIHWSSRPVAP